MSEKPHVAAWKAGGLLDRLRNSMWLVPSAITAAMAGLAFLMVWIDQQELVGRGEAMFVFAAGVEGARDVLSTIAGSIITVTGVVFSITIVALQLASSQFTPRVLRSFTEDRPTQIVLGIFIGTFTYSLLVLRTVRSEIDDSGRFVPYLAVTVGLVLAILSVGFLIYFINHITRSIRAEVILDRVTNDALEIVDHLFPEDLGAPADSEEYESPAEHPSAAVISSSMSGYLQAVDEDMIMELAESNDLILHMRRQIGDFIVEGDVLVSVSPEPDENTRNEVRRAFQLGPERTRYQDVERGLIELTDIGVRALSPGINDPTTALVCIDRLTQVFARLGERAFPDVRRKGSDGKIRVVARRVPFEAIVQRTFGQLVHHGASQPIVAGRLASALERLAERTAPARRLAFTRELDRLREKAG